ncbi:MAG TPA: hypothetical protein VEV39_00440 [Gemmatimonadales bacterium]|nr:hypothetical protein [Gemmatimonadales bacterium]
MPGDWSPQNLLWHVRIDHAVTLTRNASSNQPVSTQDVYVGLFDPANESFGLRAAGATQPDGKDYRYLPPHIGQPRADYPLATAHATRIPDSPAVFDATH